jgi:hypothetical protein
MKIFLIIFAFISSAVAAIVFNMQLLQEIEQKDVSKKEFVHITDRIHQNLSLMRSITKEADVQDIHGFQLHSESLLQEIDGLSAISDQFKQDYLKLYTIVNQTALSIQKRHPDLSQKRIRVKEQTATFDKKLKSIGLPELKTNWYEMQKLYHQFMREPYAEVFKSYRLKQDQTKRIITELYLDDPDEAQLFSFLDQHNEMLSAFHMVYNDVGLAQICELKPLMYGLKEKLQFNETVFNEASVL